MSTSTLEAHALQPPGSPQREALKARQSRLRARWGEHMQDRAVEWFSGLVMICWGATLAGPGRTLDLPSYAAFHWLPWMTETMWAWVFGVCGATRWVALYVNGSFPRGPHVRIGCAMFGAVSWAMVAVMVTVSNAAAYGVIGTGLAVYGPLALVEIISAYRASYDARYPRREH